MNSEFVAPTKEEEFYRETHTCYECDQVKEDVVYSEQFDRLVCGDCLQDLIERRIEGVRVMMEGKEG